MSKASTNKRQQISMLEREVEIHLLRARIAVAKIEALCLEPLQGDELHAALEEIIESARHQLETNPDA